MFIYCVNLALLFAYLLIYYMAEKKYLCLASTSRSQQRTKEGFQKKWRGVACIVAAVQLFLISALRTDTGFDLSNYKIIFTEISHLKIKDFLGHPVEKGYETLNAIIAMFTQNFQWVIVITSFITIFFLTIAIYRYSENCILSFLLYVPFFYFFTLSGIRQGIAFSISLLSFQFLREKKFWKYLVVILVATSFHYTAIIMLPAYFLVNVKLNWKRMSALGVIAFIVYLFTEKIFLVMTQLIPKYSPYGTEEGIAQYLNGQSWKSMVVSILVFVLMLFFHRQLEKKDVRNSVYLNISFLSVLISLFQTKVGVLDRFPYYFNIYMIFSLPLLLDCVDRRLLIDKISILPHKLRDWLQSHIILKLSDSLLKCLFLMCLFFVIMAYSLNILMNNYFGILPYHTIFSA